MIPQKIDAGALLDAGEWTLYQKALTALAALAVVFDGFDIQVLGFALPSMMRQWQLPRSEFAPILALGLVGMVVASPLGGACGDRFGRRSALIGSVLVFGIATVATAFSRNLVELAVLRTITGMGVGSALPNAAALVTEFAPLRRRAVAVTLTIICVPLGGMFAGLIAAWILQPFGWQALYLVGGAAPLAVALLLFAALPESPRFLVRHPGRWNELAGLLARMGRPTAPGSAFEDRQERLPVGRAGLRALFGAVLRRDTTGLLIAFFSCLWGIYLVFGWLPTLLTSEGMSVAAASSGLAAYNFGGVLGVLLWAALITLYGSRRPLLLGSLACVASALALCFLPVVPHGNHALLIVAVGVNGLLANAVQTSMYALASHVYPTQVRALGVSVAAGVGRLGAMLSSLGGAVILQGGAPAYWATIAAFMMCTFIGLAVVRGHYPPRGATHL